MFIPFDTIGTGFVVKETDGGTGGLDTSGVSWRHALKMYFMVFHPLDTLRLDVWEPGPLAWLRSFLPMRTHFKWRDSQLYQSSCSKLVSVDKPSQLIKVGTPHALFPCQQAGGMH
jgi:hypothetical protein